jgi:hypothetical protein
MQWENLGTALALIFVIEGIMPFLDPDGLRKSLQMVIEMDDKTLRIIGLVSMIVGLILLYLVH